MKHLFMVILCMLLLALFIVLTGCSGKDEHSLSVRLDDKIIKSVRLDDDDRNDVFKSSFKSDNLDNSLFVEFGKKIYLDFGDSMPDRVVIQDIILNTDGEYMYNERASRVINCESDENGFYFVVDKNPASGFSSVLEEGGKDLRGFIVRASWDGDELIYGFVIKTESII